VGCGDVADHCRRNAVAGGRSIRLRPRSGTSRADDSLPARDRWPGRSDLGVCPETTARHPVGGRIRHGGRSDSSGGADPDRRPDRSRRVAACGCLDLHRQLAGDAPWPSLPANVKQRLPNRPRLPYIGTKWPEPACIVMSGSDRPPPSGDRGLIARSPVRPRRHGIPNQHPGEPGVRSHPAARLGDLVPGSQAAPDPA
jgi:hypothetical protein